MPKQRTPDGSGSAPRWLLLIHQIPPKPDYFRAKVARKLARLGAVAVKRSVYVLPSSDGALEDFQWVAREIASEGGDATVCRASFVEGLRDEGIEALFHAARDAEYVQIAEELRAGAAQVSRGRELRGEERAQLETDLGRLKKRLAEVLARDFFGAPGRVPAEAALGELERRLARPTEAQLAAERPTRKEYSKRVWVTRKNIHVDRIASAWLVRRFIDPKATFKFVPGQGYRSLPDEVTFDMFEATFTHVGEKCTFEVLLDAFDLREVGLHAIAEIVHDIDVKDAKFARPEAPGVATMIAGIALSEPEDAPRLVMGERFFGALFEALKRKPGKRP